MMSDFFQTWGKALANLGKFDVARKKVHQGLDMVLSKVITTSINYFNVIFKFLF